jgi:hypothetical protein
MARQRNPLTKHHIKPKSLNGKTIGNIKEVPRSEHRAYHHIFSNLSPEDIIIYLNEVWFTTDKFVRPEEWLLKRGL